MSDQPRTLYGGQAVIEGVMIRGRTRAAVSVRRPTGAIARHALPLSSWANGSARRMPLIRGVLVLLETLMIGMKSLTISAQEAAEEEDGKDAEISAVGMGLMLVVSMLLAVGIFFLIPLFASRWTESAGAGPFLANVIEGALRLFLFIAYIWLIGRMKDIQRVFGYHGAEHMAVAAHEAGEPLTVKTVRRFPKEHPRCGTSFLMTVVVVSIILFVLIPREPFWFLLGSRIVLIPVIASISYEFIRYAGTHGHLLWVRILGAPNLMLQELTTRVPDDQMIEVAIDAMNYAIALDAGKALPGEAMHGVDGNAHTAESDLPIER
jgi:uncharacterized protein YqhQ